MRSVFVLFLLGLLSISNSATAQICRGSTTGAAACGESAGQCFVQPHATYPVTGPVALVNNRSVCCYDFSESFCQGGLVNDDGVHIPLLCPRFDNLYGSPGPALRNCGMRCLPVGTPCTFETSGCAASGKSLICLASRVCVDDLKDCPEATPSEPPGRQDEVRPTPPSPGPPGMSASQLGCANQGLEQCPGKDSCYDPSTQRCFGAKVCPIESTAHECGGCITAGSKSLGDSCRSNAECSVGRCSGACGVARGKCVCDSNDDCGAGAYCYKGVASIGTNQCKSLLRNGRACTRDKQCSSGRCNWGSCQACTKDRQCPNECGGGVCS